MYDHIVFVSIDTLRTDGIAASPLPAWPTEYGLRRALDTPALDQLVGGGAFFANAITAAPYTSASHASLLTGLWPPRHGAFEFFGRPLTAATLFSEASRRGYRTVLKSDFPVMIGPFLGFDRAVDKYIVEDDDAYLDAIAGAERSCSLLHFGSVHIPYGFHALRWGGQAYRTKVEELEAETAVGGVVAAADVLNETYRSAEDLELLLRYKRAIVALYAQERYDRLFELYLEGIEHFCRTRFQPVFDRLLRATAGRPTLVVLFGDHGEAYDRETYGHFNSVDEGVLRVPLLFWGPGVDPGQFTTRVRTIDALPTVYDLLGWGDALAGLDGESLVGAIRSGRLDQPRRAHSQAFVARAEQASRAQRQFLSGGEADPVEHVLYKEAVYDGDFKLSRRYHEVGSENRQPVSIAPALTLERFDEAMRPRPSTDQAALARLLPLLDDYAARGQSVGQATAVPQELLRHLQNHGYFQRRGAGSDD